ncbi:TIR-like protein FxsC [Micromonospora zamorensis]|uniref:TIR-like protein FxsC n=1 Tax=Micromonospora zamorensis TaxID=709883 RepID=UPI002E204AD6
MQPTAREVAEALWLAQHLVVSPLTTDDRPVEQPAVSPTDASAAAASFGSPIQSPPVSLATAASAAGIPLRGHPVRVPALPGLSRRREVLRALRPLRRRGPSRHRSTLDEDATATFIAHTGVRAPLLRPEPERWFDVVLAIDAAPAMRLWHPLIKDLHSVLTRSGAFRDIQTWWLTTTTDHVAVRPRPRAAARSHRELIDPTRRRLFLVITDGAADAWHDGTARATVTDWARTGPVAVLHTLPEAMWSRTGLPCLPARLSTRATGAPNTTWQVTYRRRRPTSHTPVPILSAEPTAFAAWARLIAGPTIGLPLAVVAPPPASRVPPQASESSQVMAGFLANASPAAHQLAICLSAAPLTLPIMRLVQHLVVPTAATSALAEVILGGLLIQTGDETYAFPPDIHQALHNQLRPSEKLLVHTAVTDYIAHHTEAPQATFPAVAGMDGPIEIRAEPFATLSREVTAGLGVPPTAVSPNEGPPQDDGNGDAPLSPQTATTPPQPTAKSLMATDPEAGPGTDEPQPARTVPLYFFLSYARGDEDALVQRFYEDLSAEVRLIAGLPRDEQVGFVDRTILFGERWPQRLVEALGSCRSFLALMTPRYFQSEACGQEWQLFADRIAQFDSQRSVDTSLLKPLMWIPARPGRIHPVAQPLQYSSNSLGELYQRLGVRQLMRMQRHHDDYRTFLFELANQIVSGAEAYPLPEHHRPIDLATVASAFHQGPTTGPPGRVATDGADTTSPMLVHFIVAAADRDEMRGVRQDVTGYGDDPLQWAPYRPPMPEPLGNYAREIAANHSYRSTVVHMDQLPRSAELAARYNQILVLIVDAWLTRLPHQRQALINLATILRGADAVTAVLIPASRDDLETREHWRSLSRACREIFDELASDDELYRSNILTHRAFKEELPEVLEVARNRLYRSRSPSQRPRKELSQDHDVSVAGEPEEL